MPLLDDVKTRVGLYVTENGLGTIRRGAEVGAQFAVKGAHGVRVWLSFVCPDIVRMQVGDT